MLHHSSLSEDFLSAMQKYTEFLLEKRVIINFHQCRFVCNLVQAMCGTSSQMKDPRLSVDMHTICTAAIYLLEMMGGARETHHPRGSPSHGSGGGGNAQNVTNMNHVDNDDEALVQHVSHLIPFYEAQGRLDGGLEEVGGGGAWKRGGMYMPSSGTSFSTSSEMENREREQKDDWGCATSGHVDHHAWGEDEAESVFLTACEMDQEVIGGRTRFFPPSQFHTLQQDHSSSSSASPSPSSSSSLLLLSPESARRHRNEVMQDGGWPFLLLHHFTCERLFQGWMSRYETGWKMYSHTEMEASWKAAVELDKRKNAEILRQWFQPTLRFLQRRKRRYIPWPGVNPSRPSSPPPLSSPSTITTTVSPSSGDEKNLEMRTEDKIGTWVKEGEEEHGEREKDSWRGSAAPSCTPNYDDAVQEVGVSTSFVGAHPTKDVNAAGEAENEEENKKNSSNGMVLTAKEIMAFYGHPQHSHWRVMYEDLDYVSYNGSRFVGMGKHQQGDSAHKDRRETELLMERKAGELITTTAVSTDEEKPVKVLWEERDDVFHDFRGRRGVLPSPPPSGFFSSTSSEAKQMQTGRQSGNMKGEKEPHFVLQSGYYWHHVPVQLQLLEGRKNDKKEDRIMEMAEEEVVVGNREEWETTLQTYSLAVQETCMFFVEEAVLRSTWAFPGLVRFFGAFTEKFCTPMEERGQRWRWKQIQAGGSPSSRGFDHLLGKPSSKSGSEMQELGLEEGEDRSSACSSLREETSSSYSEDRDLDPSSATPTFIPVAAPKVAAESSSSFSSPRLSLGLLREDLGKIQEGNRTGRGGEGFVTLASLLYCPTPVQFTPSEVVDILLQVIEVMQYLKADYSDVPSEVWHSWMTLSPSCLYVQQRDDAFSPRRRILLLECGEKGFFSSSVAIHRFEASRRVSGSPMGRRGYSDPWALPTSNRAYTSSSTTTLRPFTATPSQRKRNEERFMETAEDEDEDERESIVDAQEKEMLPKKSNHILSTHWYVKYAPPCYVSNGIPSRWRPHPAAQSPPCYALAQLFLALWTRQEPYNADWFYRSSHSSPSRVSSLMLGKVDEEDEVLASCGVKEGILPGMVLPSSLSPCGRELCRDALSLDKTVAPMTLETFKEVLLRWESENDL